MTAIIIKDGLYLNSRYQWGVIPHLFPHWQAGNALEMMLRCKDAPTGYAVGSGKSINLDALEVVRL